MAGNAATLDELMSFYKSEQYISLLSEFANRSKQYPNLLNEFAIHAKQELDDREADAFNLFFKLLYCQRRYMILGVPLEKVISEIESNKETFLNYQVSATDFFNEQEIDSTYLIEKFCEFYLLQTGDQNRLLHYLIVVKPSISFSPRKYAKEITQLYHQTINA